MDFIISTFQNYASFFSLHEMIAELQDPKSWLIIVTLVILEGLLSADNALVLAMMVNHLPEEQRKKALTYGIWGAYIFRFIAIGIGSYLVKIWWVKLLAAAYLVYMTVEHFSHGKKSKKASNKQRGFWATIVYIELMDIAFSIDSITAALGLSDKMWVLFLGAILGILMMRGVAKVFVKLIDTMPELEHSAYILVGFVGLKMALETFHIEIPDLVFFALLGIIFGSTFIIHAKNKKRNNNTTA